MFGFSLAELAIVLLVILFFIKPKDLPEIARYIGKAIYHGKKLYEELKKSLKDLEKEFEIDSLKNEINNAIIEEKIKHEEEEESIIVDMYGNEHRVGNLSQVRPDLAKEELQNEIAKSNLLNRENLQKNS
ncbi:MAG: twin-arginine translocase TatA/TatE family subunit [Alphaproteobacteria bacterium]